jgi:hypothetical protein
MEAALLHSTAAAIKRTIRPITLGILNENKGLASTLASNGVFVFVLLAVISIKGLKIENEDDDEDDGFPRQISALGPAPKVLGFQRVDWDKHCSASVGQ